MNTEQAPIHRTITAIEQAWNEGCPVATKAEELAHIAVRRWFSSERRGIDQGNHEARIEDLAKGLIAYQERNPALIGPLKADYRYLAGQIASCFEPVQKST